MTCFFSNHSDGRSGEMFGASTTHIYQGGLQLIFCNFSFIKLYNKRAFEKKYIFYIKKK